MTIAAALEISSRRTLFFFWDDVPNFDVLEKLAVLGGPVMLALKLSTR